MRPNYFNRIDRFIFTSHARSERFERRLDVGLALVIAASLAAIFWG
jgi:hypothetical protein